MDISTRSQCRCYTQTQTNKQTNKHTHTHNLNQFQVFLRVVDNPCRSSLPAILPSPSPLLHTMISRKISPRFVRSPLRQVRVAATNIMPGRRVTANDIVYTFFLFDNVGYIRDPFTQPSAALSHCQVSHQSTPSLVSRAFKPKISRLLSDSAILLV